MPPGLHRGGEKSPHPANLLTPFPPGTSVGFAATPGLPCKALCGLSAELAATLRQPALFPRELTW